MQACRDGTERLADEGDQVMDYTSIHPLSAYEAHRAELHLWRGAPQNHDETRPIQVLVNHGYVVGFCPARLQPAWSAYRVAGTSDDVDYNRPLHYHDDMRLPEAQRIGPKTFGKLGGISLQVGHMAPNEVINRQFGRLAQMETFLMSNMSPQYGSLNTGVWSKLEKAIREIEDKPGEDHVWVIVGPVFGEEPASIGRGVGKHVPVPDAYFCVTVEPGNYPYDTTSRMKIDCFIIPQDAPRDSSPADYPAKLEEVEAATNLEFFPAWGRPLEGALASTKAMSPDDDSQLMTILKAQRAATPTDAVTKATAESDTVEGLIDDLKGEANQLEALGRALSDDELARVRTIQHTISYLLKVRPSTLAPAATKPEAPPTLITYKIVSDMGGRLQQGARTACNFWNRFVSPKESIVIRLETFTENSQTIALAYEPGTSNGVRYGRVKFNTKFLATFPPHEIAGTIAHEIGHSLGIGWKDWSALYDHDTGKFTADAVAMLPALRKMEVELDGGGGTAHAHWDEERFGKELMTGYQESGEHVLPVTIKLLGLLEHTVKTELARKTSLKTLLDQAASMLFSQQKQVLHIDLDYFEETPLLEEIPHRRPS